MDSKDIGDRSGCIFMIDTLVYVAFNVDNPNQEEGRP
jgi:hypothetical protein